MENPLKHGMFLTRNHRCKPGSCREQKKGVILPSMSSISLLTPTRWASDYRLIDSGDGEKLEQFGPYVLRRPEPQAIWRPSAKPATWAKAHAHFVPDGSHSGVWERKADMPDQWWISYPLEEKEIRLRLGLTGFKHVGVFPEQASNWEFIYQSAASLPEPKVLNLFAYTGGASLAARAAGADVIHCDAIRNVVNWASANMEGSGLTDIRWLVEDAISFVRREVKRGKKYQGIILDPPSWGHGPKGEKWKLEDMADELTRLVASLLDAENGFLVFNSYSMGFSPLVLQSLIATHFPKSSLENLQTGELYLPDMRGRKLPAGIFCRFFHTSQ